MATSRDLSTDHQRILERFPQLLKALVERELDAGNSIVRAGAGHPAPPAGDMILLAKDMQLESMEGLNGLHTYARDSSTHHTEVTDGECFFWVLTTPHAPAPLPDMDAIRNARNFIAPKEIVQEFLPGSIEMDHRGEMLIYHDEDRTADIVWTWGKGNHLYRSSLTHWWYKKERRSVALTLEEKEGLIKEFLRYASQHIGPMIVSE